MPSRLVHPIPQESAAPRGEVSAIVRLNAVEGKSAQFNDPLSLWKIHPPSLKSKVTANKPKSTPGIVVLHIKNAVQTDRRIGVKACRQTLLALVPQVIAQSASAVFRANDEETHETVLFFVSDN